MGNVLVDPSARRCTSPRASGEPPPKSDMYVPSRRPAKATDLPLERESVGVKGEKTEPLGETTITVGHRSPKEQVTSASNCPAPAADFENGGGRPASTWPTSSETNLPSLGALRISDRTVSRSSMTRARHRNDSKAYSSDWGCRTLSERQCAHARRSSPRASNARAPRTCHLMLLGSVSTWVSNRCTC